METDYSKTTHDARIYHALFCFTFDNIQFFVQTDCLFFELVTVTFDMYRTYAVVRSMFRLFMCKRGTSSTCLKSTLE